MLSKFCKESGKVLQNASSHTVNVLERRDNFPSSEVINKGDAELRIPAISQSSEVHKRALMSLAFEGIALRTFEEIAAANLMERQESCGNYCETDFAMKVKLCLYENHLLI
eukprot:IDg15989t1